MIQEIGIVVGLYVLTRLIPTSKIRAATALAILTVIVTVLVVTDLTVRRLTSANLFSLGRKQEARPSTAADATHPEAGHSTVTRAEGGSITTQLGFGIAVAKDSSLRREWIAVHNLTMPVDLDGTPGVTTAYVSKQYGGEYRYRSRFKLIVKEPIRAVEVKFFTFDVWGNHDRTLSLEQVADAGAGTKELTGEWVLYSENDVQKHYASIGYVARVRLADGRIAEAPTQAVLEEARKFSNKFTAAELEPKPPVPNSGGPNQGMPPAAQKPGGG